MELDEVKRIIDELDRGISKENAIVRLDNCAPEDLFVSATQNGYLRIGVELLKAAFISPVRSENSELTREIDVDTGYLISSDSGVDFSSFERVDEMTIESEEESTTDSIVMYLIIALLVAIPILAVVGFISIIRALFQ